MSPPLERLRRRADRMLYRALWRLYRRLFPTDARPGRQPTNIVRRVLVVRRDALGDMAVTLPALAYLHATVPDAELDVLASARNAALLAGDPRLHRVYADRGSWRERLRTIRELRARRYDVIVSPMERRGLQEGLLAVAIGGRHAARVSAWRPIRYAGLFTHLRRVPGGQRHLATRLLHLVQWFVGDGLAPQHADVADYPARIVGTPVAEARAETFLRHHDVATFVALNAWAADPRRALGTSLATEIALGVSTTTAADVAVVLTPPPSGATEAEEIAHAARARGAMNVLVAPPSTDVLDLVAMLRRAAVVVTPDTANVHLASAVGTPVVSLHTPLTANVRDWGPWNVPYRTVVLTDRRPLREVRASDVLDAFASLWRTLHR